MRPLGHGEAPGADPVGNRLADNPFSGCPQTRGIAPGVSGSPAGPLAAHDHMGVMRAATSTAQATRAGRKNFARICGGSAKASAAT